MSFVNFIEFNNSKEKALSVRTSPGIKIHTLTGIQLLPNNELPYVQTTNVTNGIELEDWTVYVVNLCSGEETDITANFLVDRIFQDTKGQAQFDWKITNVPYDFGQDLVYLKAVQAIGETFYSNVFQLTNYQSEKTCRIDYYTGVTMQSIQIQMYFWQNLKALEIGSYYERSTKNTVTISNKSQKYQRWKTDFMNNDLFIKFTDAMENKPSYVDLIRADFFEAPEIKEFTSEEDFKENFIKLSFNEDDVYSPLAVVNTPVLMPELILNSVIVNGTNAIYDFNVNNYDPRSLFYQFTQNQSNWSNTREFGAVSPQSVPFTGTGTWYFRIISPEAQSNVVQLDLGSSLVANDDSVSISKGQAIDIDVMFNDVLVGDVVISNVSIPQNGVLQLIEGGKKVRYTHDDSSNLTDSFTYTISNGIDTDTATVNLTITDLSTIGMAVLFGAPSKEVSCSFGLVEGENFGTTVYHNGINVPTIGNTIYIQSENLIPFNGKDLWYRIDGGRAIQISSQGIVINKGVC